MGNLIASDATITVSETADTTAPQSLLTGRIDYTTGVVRFTADEWLETIDLSKVLLLNTAGNDASGSALTGSTVNSKGTEVVITLTNDLRRSTNALANVAWAKDGAAVYLEITAGGVQDYASKNMFVFSTL